MTNPPKLKRKLEIRKYHDYEVKDEFSWVHQKNILEVLKDSSKLDPDVRKYLEEENAYTNFRMQDTEKFQKKLFKEIKGRMKLDDESLHFFFNKDGWEYWTKTTKENNYSIHLRKKIDSNSYYTHNLGFNYKDESFNFIMKTYGGGVDFVENHFGTCK